MEKQNLVPVEELRAFFRAEEADGKIVEEGEAGIIGQDRALRALEFGLGIESQGFNIFVAGLPGTGKETAVKGYVEKIAQEGASPPDLCYVNNFKDPYRPHCLILEAGKGSELAKDIKNLVDAARQQIPQSFDSDDYIAEKEKINREYNEQKQDLFNQLNQQATEKGFIIQSTPAGFMFVPQKDGSPLQEKDIMSMPEEEKKEIQEKKSMLENELQDTMRQVKNIDRSMNEELKKLDRQVTLYAVEDLFQHLLEKYKDLTEVKRYLENMQNDMVENVDLFRQTEESKAHPFPFQAISGTGTQEPQFKKYKVNVIVDNSETDGAPVVMEMNPTYNNIFGRIEKEPQFGALTTDFTMIRSGSLHQAHGGYFVVNIEELLKNLFTWESLKRVLKTGQLEIEEPGEKLGFISTKSLRPDPVSLQVKVILIGSPMFYHLLYGFDQDFRELFKVKAEFDTTMARNKQNISSYNYFIESFCQKEKLLPFDSTALAKIVEHGSRLAEDQKKLSTQFSEIADVIREACYYAKKDAAKNFTSKHINQAIEARVYRSNLVQEKLQEMMERNMLLIDTEGAIKGQVNGLSVLNLGDFFFGRPTRITCSIALGKEGIIDIEREARTGGRLHTKGVMILSGYLASRYAREFPLTLAARLVFEQSYSEIEGDSASSGELYTLLSALCGLPLQQNLAVTGSVNQNGEIQVIGGVNEKIEGFFELCQSRGLTGNQGVVIPAGNKENLMLKEEVLQAVREEKFHIYAINTVDEGMELLTGVKAGQKKDDGTYEENSVNFLVENALRENAAKMKEYPASKTGNENNESK